MALTEAKIKNALIKEKPYKIYDVEGLYLLVNPSGSLLWRMRYRFAKKEKTLTLGSYPLFSLWEARNKCFEAKKLLEKEIDPNEQRKLDKQKIKQKYKDTFQVIAEDWIKVRGHHWTERESKKVFSSVRTNLFPLIGRRPIADLTAFELATALKEIAKYKEGRAYRLLKHCRKIFLYARACGLVEYDITQPLQGLFKKPKAQPRNWIKEDELSLFLAKLATYENTQNRLALTLLMLTFVRSNELCGATWNEFHLDRKEWHIPAERMKMRRKHIVPLSNQAIGIIEQLRQISGQYNHVFPDYSKTNQPISGKALLYAMSSVMEYRDKATPHSIRATASTTLNENGFNGEHIEIQLSHTTGSRMHNKAFIYAYYLPERHQMMQWWADFLGEKCADIY